MAKNNFERKAIKAILNIEKKITDINNVLRDLSMKLCHIIKSKSEFYYMPKGNNNYK